MGETKRMMDEEVTGMKREKVKRGRGGEKKEVGVTGTNMRGEIKRRMGEQETNY